MGLDLGKVLDNPGRRWPRGVYRRGVAPAYTESDQGAVTQGQMAYVTPYSQVRASVVTQ